MRDLAALNKGLLKSEYDLAKAIFGHAREQGYGSIQIDALIYRHGYLDGLEVGKQKLNEFHKRRHAAQQLEKQRAAEQANAALKTAEDQAIADEGGDTDDR